MDLNLFKHTTAWTLAKAFRSAYKIRIRDVQVTFKQVLIFVSLKECFWLKQ
jgi:hypothetical protein